MINLENKRILVTGGSRGLGAEICKQLAAKGARVAVNYSASKSRGEETVAAMKGDNHILIEGDAFTHDGIDGIIKDAMDGLGGIDAIVSNHGWSKFAEWSNLNALSDEEWMKTYQANVMSHLWIMQAAQDELKKNEGSLVISASVAGLRAGGSSLAYSVAKAACIHLTKGLAKTCGPEIRVNAVAPGLMLTEWADRFTPEQIKGMEQAAALKKVSEIPAVAEMYLSLLENSSTTGICVEVSSGISL